MAISQDNLIRKQYLVSKGQVKKVEQLAKTSGTSSAEIVRLAIDAYDPNNVIDADEEALLALATDRLHEAIKVTQNARKKLQKTRAQLSKKKNN